jgi:hypothetical protein
MPGRLAPTVEDRHESGSASFGITRVEEWCVEAGSAEQARKLLAAGSGYRCHIGDCVNVEVERVEVIMNAVLIVAPFSRRVPNFS